MRFYIFFPLLLMILPLYSAQEYVVNLKDPKYQNGIISTHSGGVISSPNLRIQARHIVYTNSVEQGKVVHKVVAEGDLMLMKKSLDGENRTYVGRYLEYDFVTKTGVVYDGVTAVNLWFLGGEKIYLYPDGSFHLYNAFVTTSESKNADWKIQSRELKVTNKSYLSTKNVTFRLFDTPIFWLPSFKSNLKLITQSPVRYKMELDKGLWPKVSMRYRIYSWENLDLFFRLNVRPSKGVGAALESDYQSPEKRTLFRTRSYIDHDAFYIDTNPDKARTHYRLQGLYTSTSKDEKSQFLAAYDWLNDKNMQTDFGSKDFELGTAKQTRIEIRNYQDWMIFGIDGKFRINGFQGMKQELPQTFWTPKSYALGNSGIISENRMKVAYLDYVSAKDIESAVPDFNAVRLSTRNTLYRPFSSQGFTFTPLVGMEGIFYGNGQRNAPEALGILTYQLLCDLKLKRRFENVYHTLQPYIRYEGITHPTISPDAPYIFSIEDGFNRLNMIKSGVRNLFYMKNSPLFEPNIIADFCVYGFFGDQTFSKTVPKIQGDVIWNFPSWNLNSQLGWNLEKQTLDYANIALAWTINKDFAFKTEFRHRGRFDWRKSNPNNFIMEVTRGIDDLFHSPLSDGRNTFLSRLQIKIAPQWIARLESHIGWGRGGEPHYKEGKFDLITTISTSWRLRLTFIHSIAPHGKNNRFTFGLSIVKK